jgi:cysteine desulfurase / selenocysteine lyase
MPATTDTSREAAMTDYDVDRVREDFPILSRRVHGLPLVYLDNAATCQKPRQVIEAMDRYYRDANSNIHRGLHALSELATNQYEAARSKVRQFINASASNEIIFTRGTTESINLVAQSYARPVLQSGDEVLITHMEHHSNIVPWQIVCEQTGAELKVAPIDDRGELMVEEFRRLLSGRTRVVALAHVSNALGTINPIGELIRLAHDAGAVAMIDGAQAVPHVAVDIRDLDADFYAFSGHKLYGPTGVGVLYGKAALLDVMPPYQGGGDMIKSVTFDKTIYNDLPYKFEAGTPNIAGGIGLGAAIDYVNHIGIDRIAAWENELLGYGTRALEAIDGVRLIGTARRKAAVLSFVLDSAHPHDIGTILDRMGIAVRTGHHCAQPVMDRFDIPATARASFAAYNTRDEIDALVRGIEKVKEVFG